MSTQQSVELLNALHKQKIIRTIDVRFSQWLIKKVPTASANQVILSALVSHQLGEGHVCIALDKLIEIYQHWPKILRTQMQQLLNIDQDRSELVDQILIGDGSVLTPLVIEGNRLYLYRYWQYERSVAQRLLAETSIEAENDVLDREALRTQLDRYFGTNEQPDWQRIAAAITSRHSLSVISGGPGTGKTTTVTKLLAIYIENSLAKGKRPIIQLAAPTGKAAARLSESIAQAKQKLSLTEDVKALIPDQGKTLHRLLGVRPGTKKFVHHQDNPLLLDLLVIDEASMIDLPMMASIISALANKSKLVLIGDRDQLASVEAGSVLGDICAVPKIASYSAAQNQYLQQCCYLESQPAEVNSQAPFRDHVAFLQKSYRFDANSGIGALASACNNGDTGQVSKVLSADYPDLQVITPTEQRSQILSAALQGYKGYLETLASMGDTSAEPQILLDSFNQFQILCALRVGTYGVEQVNEQIESYFEKRQMKAVDNRWYIGRPIMITQNDNYMQLYNGDIGIACTDKETGQLKVWFEQGGELRSVLPSRLPQHETVFAMTVHKSQGSEFEHVMLLLVQSAKVINRELVYTAITRAKKQFSLFGFESLLKQAVKHVTVRTSGLAARIWQR
jgi:exodeoxyribonuclease V alpha subunit